MVKNIDPRVTAHHEAAHAVVNYRAAGFAGGPVSIVARTTADAITFGTADDCVSDSSNADEMSARILSCYAGGHAQRILDPACGDHGCGQDDDIAQRLLVEFAWEHREEEFRARSLDLVREHWGEIVAVAEELLRVKALTDTEVEIVADAVAGDPDADLTLYRARFRPQLESWRAAIIDGTMDEKGAVS